MFVFGSSVGSYGKEPLGSIRCWEISEELSDWRLLHKDSALWSWILKGSEDGV
jgi:hypothetical protein